MVLSCLSRSCIVLLDSRTICFDFGVRFSILEEMVTHLLDDVLSRVLFVVLSVGVFTVVVFHLRDLTVKHIASRHGKLWIESELTRLVTERVLSSCILI